MNGEAYEKGTSAIFGAYYSQYASSAVRWLSLRDRHVTIHVKKCKKALLFYSPAGILRTRHLTFDTRWLFDS